MRLFVSLVVVSSALNLFALQVSNPGLNKASAASTTPSTIPAIAFSSVPVSTLQLTGTATRTYGSDQQTGTVILQAAANGQSRMELDLSKGTLVETQSASTPYEGQCSQVGIDGLAHASAVHNCWRGTVWFLPQIALQAGVGWTDNIASAAVAPDGTANIHYSRRPAGTMSDQTASVIAQFSGFDLSLDATGHPLVLKFNAHPDDDSSTDIPTEIHFSDYRLVNGVTVPFHIQKFINNGLVLDLQITSVQINPTFTSSTSVTALP
jgi:hypothetical protein